MITDNLDQYLKSFHHVSFMKITLRNGYVDFVKLSTIWTKIIACHYYNFI